ncbi:hypothetical protein [Sodalis sp. RH20]|uniref:hypothetical protein n=1 Tax=unclassified Sodalis (in: enterobacteria) TaxID=2636512 RepID=UPI0039B5F1E9
MNESQRIAALEKEVTEIRIQIKKAKNENEQVHRMMKAATLKAADASFLLSYQR